MSVSLSYDQQNMILAAAPSPSDAQAAFIGAVTARLPSGPLTNQMVRSAINAALSDSAEHSTTFSNVTFRQGAAKLGPTGSLGASATVQ